MVKSYTRMAASRTGAAQAETARPNRAAAATASLCPSVRSGQGPRSLGPSAGRVCVQRLTVVIHRSGVQIQ